MSEMQVATGAVRDAGVRARALSDEFAQALHECDAIAASVVAGSWTGPASAMFHTGWEAWHRGALEVHDALASIALLLQESAAQYESTEATVTHVSRESSVTVAATVAGPR
ncbi:WXG100 family type VII secretion target [Mesorhizobium japonicum]|jgi:WXG100 family type VII secretion target|uniref:WXG100 family type VII secretion target n=1 Tax=Mesorhizobium japonicum TaxID=2066070 RepID=UPI003B592A69